MIVSIPGASLLKIDRTQSDVVTIRCPTCQATVTVPTPTIGPVRVTEFEHQAPCEIADRVARALASGRSLNYETD